MNLASTIAQMLFGLAVLGIALALSVQTRRTQARLTPQAKNDDEREFLTKQLRRRRMVNGLLATVGIAMMIGAWLQAGVLMLTFWCGVLVMVLCIFALGVADLAASRAYFQRLLDSQRVERAQIELELQKHRAMRGNGRGEK